MNQYVGLIIGGTRGIGKALVAALADHWGEQGLVYFTARREADGVAVREELRDSGARNIEFLLFDLSAPGDPERVRRSIETSHGGIDVVVQNGAYMPRAGHAAADDARAMIAANSHGSLRVMTAFLPLLRENGRMVIVASALGVLKNLPEHLRPAFDPQRCSPAEINAAIDGYVEAVESGEAIEKGWPEWVNIPSKVAQVAVTQAFARGASESGQLPAGATINAACPGVALTDATRDFMGTVFKREDAQTPEEAAHGLMHLLTVDGIGSQVHGELIQHGKVIPFND